MRQGWSWLGYGIATDKKVVITPAGEYLEVLIGNEIVT